MPIYRIWTEIPAGELMLWQHFLENEPRYEKRLDWLFASLAKAIHDTALGFAGKANPLPLHDYLLNFEAVSPEEEQKRIQQNLRRIFGNIVPEVTP
jgi:hypothetical protein